MPEKARAVRREVISWVVLATSINSSTLGLLVVGELGGRPWGWDRWGECSQGWTGSAGGEEGIDFGLDFEFGEAHLLQEGDVVAYTSFQVWVLVALL